ncbi:MAG: hypothetical protein RL570_1006, partial [Actinomycetota bacterium]
MRTVTINSAGMSMQDVIDVARHNAQVQISESALAGMAATREH